MTIDIEQLREHIETDLADGPLGRLLADAVATIEEHTGTDGAETVVTLYGGDPLLFLPWEIVSADDVALVEQYGDEIDHAVAVDDFAWRGGRMLARNINGTRGSARWAPLVIVTLTPKAQAARVDRVTVDLVRLAIQHNALASETAGDYASKSVDYQAERRRILSELAPRMVVA